MTRATANVATERLAHPREPAGRAHVSEVDGETPRLRATLRVPVDGR